MQIIKESKEKLPIDFITQFISNGWNEVGNLKASVDAIKKEFSNTKDIEAILQDLSDAYLIAIGQLQKYLQKKEYIDVPNEVKENLQEDLTEELPDKKILDLEKEEKPVEVPAPAEEETLAPELPEEDVKESLTEDVIININTNDDKCADEPEVFEYFCDFDDPVGEAPTDAEIYPFVNQN